MTESAPPSDCTATPRVLCPLAFDMLVLHPRSIAIPAAVKGRCHQSRIHHLALLPLSLRMYNILGRGLASMLLFVSAVRLSHPLSFVLAAMAACKIQLMSSLLRMAATLQDSNGNILAKFATNDEIN